MNSAAENDQPLSIREDAFRHINRAYRATANERLVATFILVEFFIFFLRPQQFITPLGTIRFALIWSLFILVLWARRARESWTPQTKAMFILLGLQAAFGVVGYFYDPFVRNDFWHFHTWKDLFQ